MNRLQHGETIPHFSCTQGLLYRKGRLVVGNMEGIYSNIIQLFHTSSLGGHSGIVVTIPGALWTDVSLDFIEGLPKSRGKDTILVVVDRLSKYAHFLSLEHPFTAAMVAQLYFDHIFKLHGIPKTLVSDRDKVFLSQFWQELFRLQHVSLHMSTAYHL